MPNHPEVLSGLASIADRFEAVLLDQWGVLTDGAKAPAGAIEAVRALHRAGKSLAVLSNSARFAVDSRNRLAAIGYDPAWFTGIVTSGETVHDLMRDRTDPFFAGLGRRVFLIAREPTLLENSAYVRADSPEGADFVLLGSSTAPECSLERDYVELLDRAVALGLPAICANPDRVGVAVGGLIEGPGALAAYYESKRGTVRYIGKPYPEVYARAHALLGIADPQRILAIGDSLEHDIAGGRQAGCQTLFVEQGIHAGDLAAPNAFAQLAARYGAWPDFSIARLAW
jgi:HAD superfamily hydrolase (TIGR01459 family)